jgi:hypothetical protein
MIDHLIIILLSIRRAYAIWALQYVPILIDGKPNPEWDRLHAWSTCERVKKYIEQGEISPRRRWRLADRSR